ncbi:MULTISPECIES: HipA domain-containing protein [Bifidobacterium]|uniref:HipA domain-containing protein n=1 Tax=Bifidobacterium TaxID=1678 RepID=UPI0015F2EE08|nr:HipA domain-containing protein [Bifidobacterium pseudocatenulatum]
MSVERLVMCGPHPVLSFEYDDHVGTTVGSGRILDAARLPLELVTHGKPAVYAARIDMWWRRRAIPSSRDGICHALDVLGVRSTVDLLNRSRGLSLSDQYWVKDSRDPARWEEVNFFDNPFDEELGRVLLTTVSSSHEFSFDVPDASTGGDLPKRWTVDDSGTRILVKGGRTGQEPVNEVIASRLARRLDIPAVDYRLAEYDNRPVCLCDEMLSRDEEMVSAWQLMESIKRNNRLSVHDQWVEDAVAFGCARGDILHATDDWLLVDWLTRNTDRHFNNFGLIRNINTFEVRPAPLFDTGTSLWAGQLRVTNEDYRTRPFYSTYKTPTARRQLRLVSDWSRFNLEALSDWPDEVAHRLSVTGMLAPARIAAIRDALHGRVSFARQVRDESVPSLPAVRSSVRFRPQADPDSHLLPMPSPMENPSAPQPDKPEFSPEP